MDSVLRTPFSISHLSLGKKETAKPPRIAESAKKKPALNLVLRSLFANEIGAANKVTVEAADANY